MVYDPQFEKHLALRAELGKLQGNGIGSLKHQGFRLQK
jgi:hypothetical protein